MQNRWKFSNRDNRYCQDKVSRADNSPELHSKSVSNHFISAITKWNSTFFRLSLKTSFDLRTTTTTWRNDWITRAANFKVTRSVLVPIIGYSRIHVNIGSCGTGSERNNWCRNLRPAFVLVWLLSSTRIISRIRETPTLSSVLESLEQLKTNSRVSWTPCLIPKRSRLIKV